MCRSFMNKWSNTIKCGGTLGIDNNGVSLMSCVSDTVCACGLLKMLLYHHISAATSSSNTTLGKSSSSSASRRSKLSN